MAVGSWCAILTIPHIFYEYIPYLCINMYNTYVLIENKHGGPTTYRDMKGSLSFKKLRNEVT